MKKALEQMGYKNEFKPTGIVVKCNGNGKHNNKVGTVHAKGNTLYIKLGGIYVKADNLKERGYKLATYQKWAQSTF